MLLCLMLIFVTIGCSATDAGTNTDQTATGTDARIDTGFIVYGPDSYDSADTPVLIAKDETSKTMTFLNLSVGKEYTLEYDGTTCFYDKYGKIMSLSQIAIGEIVDVKFIKIKKHLTSMSISSDGWTVNNTTRYSIDTVKKDVTIGDETYNISSDISYFSKDKEIQLQDLIATDTLTFHGIGTTVYSVIVENGHGYLRISGQQNFVGGWIEVGNSIIERVTEDMLLTVPEGTYQVKMSYSGTTSEKRVTIYRNSESKLDYSDVVFEDPKVGTVLFSLTPSSAELYVDGEKVDATLPIELTYGLHQLICRADGYTSVTQYLNVGQTSAGIDITLEKKEDTDTDSNSDSNNSDSNSSNSTNSDASSSSGDTGSDSSNSSDGSNNGGNTGNGGTDGSNSSGSGNSTNSDANSSNSDTGSDSSDGSSQTTVTTYYQVHIDSPENVEVYLDGAYVGVSPCSFRKKEGSHIITLSKDGYVTRSYTIYVDSEDKDVSFSFVELTQAN